MNVTHGLRRALQVNAGGVAMMFGDRQRTWAEVGDRVARFAGALRAMGVSAGDRVGRADAEPGSLPGTLSRRRLGRRRDRAGEHPLEPGGDRGLAARLPPDRCWWWTTPSPNSGTGIARSMGRCG